MSDPELALAVVQVAVEGLAAGLGVPPKDWSGLGIRLGFERAEMQQLYASCHFGRHDASAQESASKRLEALGRDRLDAPECSHLLRRLIAAYLVERHNVSLP